MYAPSLDWANELPTSLLWAGKAWLITAAATVVVLVLLARHTSWGRQFWRVSGGYFRGRTSIGVWLWLGVLLFSTLIAVRLEVLLSYFVNDLYSSLQVAFEGAGAGNDAVRDSGVRGFWTAILTFVLIAALYVSRQLIDIYLTQNFIIRWRVWLTDRLTGDWLDGESFYRGRFIDNPVDNPDQRIQLDIDAFTAMHRDRSEHPDRRHHHDTVVRRHQRHGVGGGLHPDPVEPVRAPDVLRCDTGSRAVLDRTGLCVRHDGDRVLDRPPADPVQLPQRTDQRRVPLRTGPDA